MPNNDKSPKNLIPGPYKPVAHNPYEVLFHATRLAIETRYGRRAAETISPREALNGTVSLENPNGASVPTDPLEITRIALQAARSLDQSGSVHYDGRLGIMVPRP